jgi:hypothetical protein
MTIGHHSFQKNTAIADRFVSDPVKSIIGHANQIVNSNPHKYAAYAIY